MNVVQIEWDRVLSALEAEEYEDDTERDVKSRKILIGSILNLTPSGKVYTPWSNSHVTQEEADKDEEWWKNLEVEAAERGLSIESGEGDPCDIFVVQYKNEGE